MTSPSVRKHAGPGPSSDQPPVPEPTFAERARTLVYLGRTGSLSTLSRKQPGFPFGSVMPYALDNVGRPIFLISTMAMHTQNLQADARASLLVTQDDSDGDPLGASRVTLVGNALPILARGKPGRGRSRGGGARGRWAGGRGHGRVPRPAVGGRGGGDDSPTWSGSSRRGAKSRWRTDRGRAGRSQTPNRQPHRGRGAALHARGFQADDRPGRIDIVQMDICHCGGLLASKKFAALAAARTYGPSHRTARSDQWRSPRPCTSA